jgi:hypothetical protein
MPQRIFAKTDDLLKNNGGIMKNQYVVLLYLFLFIYSHFLYAQPSTPRDSAWVTNGTVYSIAYQKGIAYLGGSFSYVGPNRPHGAVVNANTGETNLIFPTIVHQGESKAGGSVYAVASDGSNGWYIGGNFTHVGGVARNNIAHIRSDGSVDQNWNPNASHGYNQDVDVIVISGGIVYAGGRFSNIGGINRSNVAALDATTGLATTWNPNADGMVRSIVVSGSVVYLAGDFSWIGGYGVNNRNRIAAIDVSTGSATSWNPNCNNSVYAINVSGGTVYLGGNFTQVGGQVRNYLAAVNASDAALTSWNPNADNTVQTMILNGSIIYAGGSFTTIAGQVRNKIAAINTASSTVTSWNPNANGAVRSIVVNGSTIFAAGDFTSIGLQTRGYIAGLDASTGSATSWISNALDDIYALAINGTQLFVGGIFRSIGGQYRNNLAAIDAVNGYATSWNPQTNGRVWEVTANGSTIYLGGEFTTVNGTTRNYIASVDASTGTLSSWNPNANNYVYAITLDGSTAYIGGDFSNIGGQARNKIAAIDASTGNASGWNPNANGWVTAITINASTVYIGGAFSNIAGTARNYLAAIDATTGALTNWNPNITSYGGAVYSILLNNGLAYIGGAFTAIAGTTRYRLAAIDLSTGVANGWNPNSNGTVKWVALGGSNIFAAGQFTNVGGYARNYFAGIDATTGVPNGWSPNADYPNYEGSYAVTVTNDTVIFAGGNFNTLLNGTLIQDYVAQFGTVKGNPVPSITSASPSTVNRLQTVNVTLTGSGFINGITTVSFGSNITVNSITVNSSTQLVANITVAASASTGARTISATNDAPGGGTGTLSNGLTINNPSPTLSSISPSAGNRLQTLDVSFTGTNLINGVSSVNAGTGITVNSVTVISSTSLTTNLTITATASTGAQNFSVTNAIPGGGTSSTQSFTISNPLPTLTNASPAVGNRLQTLNVTLTGTNFISGTTSVSFGSEVTVNSTTVNSATEIAANITIAGNAVTGFRTISVTNTAPGGGTANLSNVFSIGNPTPTLVSITPSSANKLQTIDIAVKGTNFVDAATALNVGSNITVNSLAVIKPDSLTTNITIGANATSGLRNFSVTNGAPGGGTSNTLSFTVNNPVPTLSAINPSSATRYQSLNVTFAGTDFIDNSVTSINTGGGITVNSIAINSPTTLTANITVGPKADTGTRNFSVTNSAPIGGTSESQIFTVAKQLPTAIAIFSGNNQVASLDSQLINPCVVIVKDSTGNPIEGIKVKFSIASFPTGSTGQSLSDSIATTDSAGKAPSKLKLGNEIGEYTVAASVVGSVLNPVVFSTLSPVPTLIASSRVLAFGDVGIYDSSLIALKVTNSSVNRLSIDSIYTLTSLFKTQVAKGDVAKTDTLKLGVKFFPSAFGTFSDTLFLKNNSDTALIKIALSGKSPFPTIFVTPNTIAFGNVKKDSTKQLLFSITNTSVSALQIDSLYTKTKYFDIVHILANKILKKGDTVGVSIRFTPDTIGQYIDTLFLTNNSQTSPVKVPLNGNGSLTRVEQFGSEIPTVFSLYQNYPNPFNPFTTIRFGVPERSRVRIEVINTLGQRITTLMNEVREPGYYETHWQANVASGIYFYRIEALSINASNKRFMQVKKMILMR